MMRSNFFIATLCALLMLVSACATTAKVWKPYDAITIAASKSVNPDSNGRASPIQIKIYELTAKSTFENLDFDRAFYQAKTLLSDQLLSEAEYTLQPGETAQHTIKLRKTAAFIAISAGFIDIDNARWRHIYKVKDHGHYKHHINIVEKAISFGKEKEKPENIKENSEKIKKGKETLESFLSK